MKMESGKNKYIQKKERIDFGININHTLRSCKFLLKENKSNRNTTQYKKITDSTMQSEAVELSNNNRSTVAVGKIDSSDRYVIYAQRVNDKLRKAIPTNTESTYENVDAVHWENSNWSGLHAEMFAISNNENITKIAASQNICKRCLAALNFYGITAVNPGTQYTEQWIAPYGTEINETNPFPAKALRDTQRNGISGFRYGMDSNLNYYQISKESWTQHHTTW